MNIGRLNNPSRRSFMVGLVAAATWSGFAKSELAARTGLSQQSVSRLGDSLQGSLILPPHNAYASARRAVSHNPLTDTRPLAIAYCETTADIARCVEFALEHDLPLAARSGGCDILGRSSCDEGLIVDLSEINLVQPRPDDGLVSIGAGATAGLINSDLAEVGLAVPLGCDPMVGVGGLTLGGGLGWLLGSRGTASDNLRSAQIVMADGSIMNTSARENSDLFWGLNGGGGNFGIVSRMDFETCQVRQVIGGYIVYPLHVAQDVLLAYPHLMATAPRELMVELASINTARGPVLVAMTCFSGSATDAACALAPFLDIAPYLAEDIGQREYQFVGNPSRTMIDAFPPPSREFPSEMSADADNFNHWRGCNLIAIDERTASSIVDAMENAPPGGSFGLGHFMKGAALDVSPHLTAMPRHQGSMCAYFTASWTDPSDSVQRMQWVAEATEAISARSSIPTYINYLASDAELDIRRTYGENYQRLAELKSRWDPCNIFNNNRNIRPG